MRRCTCLNYIDEINNLGEPLPDSPEHIHITAMSPIQRLVRRAHQPVTGLTATSNKGAKSLCGRAIKFS
jgi:hypothetical protein